MAEHEHITSAVDVSNAVRKSRLTGAVEQLPYSHEADAFLGAARTQEGVSSESTAQGVKFWEEAPLGRVVWAVELVWQGEG